MKFFLAFVSTVCLMGGIHAQIANVASTLASAISTSTANLDSALQSVNSSIIALDQTILNSWTAYCNSMNVLYNSYLTKYQAYTTVDLNPITNAITDLQNMMVSQPWLLGNDYNVQSIFETAQTSAQQIQDALNAAVASMTVTCGSTCTSTKAVNCINRFGGQLNSTTITIDRITACIAPEATRITEMDADVVWDYTTSLTMATDYLMMDDMCDVPAAAVLNNPSPIINPPQTTCFTNYLSRFSSVSVLSQPSSFAQSSTVPLISFRATRCARMVAQDIQARIDQILTRFTECL